MLIFVVFSSCLLYTLSSAQTNSSILQPTLGPVYPVANNNSLLNFTFIYPANYQFANLYVAFTIYDFINYTQSNPQPYAFSWTNFTNSNTSLPWVIPPNTGFQPGDYIIACFVWVQTNNNSVQLANTNQCILTRASINYTMQPIASTYISPPVVTNTTATINAYYPAVLPYDQVSISSTLNGTTLPTMTNSSANTTYMYMNTFSYMNLSTSTYYNMCVVFNYANSKINGTQQVNTSCQTIMTLAGNSVNKAPNKVISNFIIIILLFILASI